MDQIIFVADYIEPNRDQAPRLAEIRQMAFCDLDLATLMILEDTMSFVKLRGMFMDPMTVETYDHYMKKTSDNKKED